MSRNNVVPIRSDVEPEPHQEQESFYEPPVSQVRVSYVGFYLGFRWRQVAFSAFCLLTIAALWGWYITEYGWRPAPAPVLFAGLCLGTAVAAFFAGVSSLGVSMLFGLTCLLALPFASTSIDAAGAVKIAFVLSVISGVGGVIGAFSRYGAIADIRAKARIMEAEKIAVRQEMGQ